MNPKLDNQMLTGSLKDYIEASVLPLYDGFDAVYDHLTSPHPQQCQCLDCQPSKYRKNLTSSR